MGNSLGSYVIEQSSSSDLKNIKWTQKNPVDPNKSKIKRKSARKTSPLNVVYIHKSKTITPQVEKVFKIDMIIRKRKLKNKKEDKKFQTSSASNCIIKQGFTRPAR